ncbi:hypothetical protein DRQ09_10585 [candidate division KSB1 bacterium]|nr:MAG: hypothetical protein DRQ09_10585 [candidate division KSB1 bacterium]
MDEEKNILYLTIYEGKLDTTSIARTRPGGVVKKVVPQQLPENAQIAFYLNKDIENREIFREKGSNDIIISLMPFGAKEKAIRKSKDEIIKKDKISWKVDKIVIDPGHGGKDPGTIGLLGTKEKDITLDIAKRLGRLIKKNLKIKVIYTRTKDKYVTLRQRAEIANSNKGKLFISIHVNSTRKSRSIRGFETFFLRPGKNKNALEVLEVVERENSVINLYEASKDEYPEYKNEDLNLLSMTQNAFVKLSEELAFQISIGLDRELPWKNRGVKQAGFLVLWGISMPNVLVEVGYLSNRYEEKSLRTRAIRQKIAQGIFNGIKNYIEKEEKSRK